MQKALDSRAFSYIKRKFFKFGEIVYCFDIIVISKIHYVRLVSQPTFCS